MDERMRKEEVLYLSYDGLTDPLGQSQVLPYLTGLASVYSITIISFEKADRFKQDRETIASTCEQYQLAWIPLLYHKSPPVLSTLYDLFQLYRHAEKVVTKKRPRLVHCRSYITALIGLRLQRTFGLKFLFDMRGFWADERVEAKIWNLRNPLFGAIYKFFKIQESRFFNKADHVVALTQNSADVILQNHPNAIVTVIPTCVDLDLFDRNIIKDYQRKEVREKLKISVADFVLVYIGSWERYLTAEMMAFFECVKEVHENAKFLILSKEIIDVSQYSCAKDIVVVGVGRKEMPLYISVANMAVYFHKSSFASKATSATKLGELIALNMPVITNGGVGDVESILKHYAQSYLVRDFSKSEYRLAIQKISYEPADTRELRDYFSLQNGIKKYRQIYTRLLTTP